MDVTEEREPGVLSLDNRARTLLSPPNVYICFQFRSFENKKHTQTVVVRAIFRCTCEELLILHMIGSRCPAPGVRPAPHAAGILSRVADLRQGERASVRC